MCIDLFQFSVYDEHDNNKIQITNTENKFYLMGERERINIELSHKAVLHFYSQIILVLRKFRMKALKKNKNKTFYS